MCAMTRHYELSNQDWEKLKPFFAYEDTRKRGRPGKDSREMFNAILWVLGSGLPWRELPDRYGKWSTVYKRYIKWKNSGLLTQALNTLDQIEQVRCG